MWREKCLKLHSIYNVRDTLQHDIHRCKRFVATFYSFFYAVCPTKLNKKCMISQYLLGICKQYTPSLKAKIFIQPCFSFLLYFYFYSKTSSYHHPFLNRDMLLNIAKLRNLEYRFISESYYNGVLHQRNKTKKLFSFKEFF